MESTYESDSYLDSFLDNQFNKVEEVIQQEQEEESDINDIKEWFDPEVLSEVLNNERKNAISSIFKNYNFTNDIVAKESGGNYKATNPNSSAVGKYQFLWNTWGDKIAAYTGVNNKQEFLNSPQAQDDFYENYYLPNELFPAVRRLKAKGANLSTNQLAKLVHFRGEKGALDWLRGGVQDKPENYNMSIPDYIGLRQAGGSVNWNMNYPKLEQQTYVVPMTYKTPENKEGYLPITPKPQNTNMLDISPNSTYNQTLQGQQENFLNLTGSNGFSGGFLPTEAASKSIDAIDSAGGNLINMVGVAKDMNKGLKNIAAKSLSGISTATDLILNLTESRNRALRRMEQNAQNENLYTSNSDSRNKLNTILN